MVTNTHVCEQLVQCCEIKVKWLENQCNDNLVMLNMWKFNDFITTH